MKTLKSMKPVWGFELFMFIMGLMKSLTSKKAKIAFKTAVLGMSEKAITIPRTELVYNKDGKVIVLDNGHLKTKKKYRGWQRTHTGAWRERLLELRGYLPAFESVEKTHTKMQGARKRGDWPGIKTRHLYERTTLENIGPDNDPVIGLRQEGRGPWIVLDDGRQASEPMDGESTIQWRMCFLSGRESVCTVHILVEGGKVTKTRFQAPIKDLPYFTALKSRMMEYMKFGPCPEKRGDKLVDLYTLDHPILLDAEEIEELKGLMAAELVAEYMELSKTNRGAARRGTKESLAKDPTTEADMFRDRRAAKAIQKRTNRSAEEGIGEYAGGGQFEVSDVVPDYRPVVDTIPTLGISIVDANFLKIRELVRELIKAGTKKDPEVEKKLDATISGCAADVDGHRGPSKEDWGRGRIHPARSFRLGLFGRPGPDGYWISDSEPCILNKENLTLEYRIGKQKLRWKYLDVRGLSEAIYEELEIGELLFWVESYEGRYSYGRYKNGITVPHLMPSTDTGRNRIYKEDKPKLRCQHCGGSLWRQDLHAEVCDTCDSEAFPRNWINVLIPISRLANFLEFDKGVTHAKIRLYGKPVGWVIREAFRRGVDVTRPHTEQDFWFWAGALATDEKPIIAKTWPVGLGRFLHGPEMQHTERSMQKYIEWFPHIERASLREQHSKLGKKYILPEVFKSDPTTGNYNKEEGNDHGS